MNEVKEIMYGFHDMLYPDIQSVIEYMEDHFTKEESIGFEIEVYEMDEPDYLKFVKKSRELANFIYSIDDLVYSVLGEEAYNHFSTGIDKDISYEEMTQKIADLIKEQLNKRLKFLEVGKQLDSIFVTEELLNEYAW